MSSRKPKNFTIRRDLTPAAALLAAGLSYASPAIAQVFQPPGTVLICESSESIGFDWVQASRSYERVTYKASKYIVKWLSKERCSVPSRNWEESVSDKSLRWRDICISFVALGKTEKKFGAQCTEYVKPSTNSSSFDTNVTCSRGLFTPQLELAPNGFYHLAHINDSVTDNPSDGEKGSQYIEWGRCSVISVH